MTLQDETITMPQSVGSRIPCDTASLQSNWHLAAVFSTNSEIDIVYSTHSDLIKFFMTPKIDLWYTQAQSFTASAGVLISP